MTGWDAREPGEPLADWMLRLQLSYAAAEPRPATEVWDAATDAEADIWFATLTGRQVRRRQELCHAQMRIAFRARDDQALENLQRMDAALMRALLDRTPERSMT